MLTHAVACGLLATAVAAMFIAATPCFAQQAPAPEASKPIPPVQPQPNGATCDFHNVQAQAVNPKMRPQAIYRPADSGIQIVRVQPV
jgi:hypothetical protein